MTRTDWLGLLWWLALTALIVGTTATDTKRKYGPSRTLDRLELAFPLSLFLALLAIAIALIPPP